MTKLKDRRRDSKGRLLTRCHNCEVDCQDERPDHNECDVCYSCYEELKHY